MGGHDHHHEPYKVPDYRIYKVEQIPKLRLTQEVLASEGLRDPWLRNEVWRYDRQVFGTENSRLFQLFYRGFRVGFAAFLVTVAGTAIYDHMYPDQHGHGNGDEHEEDQ